MFFVFFVFFFLRVETRKLRPTSSIESESSVQRSSLHAPSFRRVSIFRFDAETEEQKLFLYSVHLNVIIIYQKDSLSTPRRSRSYCTTVRFTKKNFPYFPFFSSLRNRKLEPRLRATDGHCVLMSGICVRVYVYVCARELPFFNDFTCVNVYTCVCVGVCLFSFHISLFFPFFLFSLFFLFSFYNRPSSEDP